MKVFTTVFSLGVFLVLLGVPEKILADREPTSLINDLGPHEEYLECGTGCESTCGRPNADQDCTLMCKRGSFCMDGYVRAYSDGICIRPYQCHQQSVASANNVYEPMLLFIIGLSVSMRI